MTGLFVPGLTRIFKKCPTSIGFSEFDSFINNIKNIVLRVIAQNRTGFIQIDLKIMKNVIFELDNWDIELL
jgi:hypothetical protein